MAFINTIPVVSSARLNISRCSVRPARPFVGAQSAIPHVAPTSSPSKTTVSPRMEFEISEGVPFDLNPTVILIAFIGWIVPSSIPTTIPLTEGTGLTQAFIASMQANLAAFPKGPALSDPFWLLLLLWHVGLFATLIFGTIGYNLSKVEKE